MLRLMPVVVLLAARLAAVTKYLQGPARRVAMRRGHGVKYQYCTSNRFVGIRKPTVERDGYLAGCGVGRKPAG